MLSQKKCAFHTSTKYVYTIIYKAQLLKKKTLSGFGVHVICRRYTSTGSEIFDTFVKMFAL